MTISTHSSHTHTYHDHNASSPLTIRKFRWDDLPAIRDLIHLTSDHDNEEEYPTLEQIEHDWRSPEYRPETECFVVHNPQGQLVAFVLTENPRLPEKAYGGLCVHPDYRAGSLAGELIRLSDMRFYNDVKDVIAPEKPISVQRWASDHTPYYGELYTAEGYTAVRAFYQMAIDLSAPLTLPPLPEGFEIRPFESPAHDLAVYEAATESFRDHWGTVAVPFDQWRRMRIEEPDFRADMWYIAWAGDEVAGVALCKPWGEDIPGRAWVDLLGVRRAYRKRGLGEALLKHAFHQFQALGFSEGGLGVDASSLTNAVALYERAGMHVYRSSTIYRRMYRGRLEDVQD